MAKTKSSALRNTKPSARRKAKQSAAQRANTRVRAPARSPRAASAHKAGTKQAQILAMLRSPRGATIAALMEQTGWQQHSVRGYLAGVVRKRLKLDLVSDKTDKGRVYRITDKFSGAGQGGPVKDAR